jgi:hypothetical protein
MRGEERELKEIVGGMCLQGTGSTPLYPPPLFNFVGTRAIPFGSKSWIAMRGRGEAGSAPPGDASSPG